jgi:hypothetical protein
MKGSTSCEVCSKRKVPVECTYDGVFMAILAKKGVFFKPLNIEQQNHTFVAQSLGRAVRKMPNDIEGSNLNRSWRAVSANQNFRKVEIHQL